MEALFDIAKSDKKAELECTLLPGLIQTKNVADRILEAVRSLTTGTFTETSLLRVFYPDDIRVEVESPHLIQKVCGSNSFKGVPLEVQKKSLYRRDEKSKDTIDIPDLYARLKLRSEVVVRKDWDASPTDPKTVGVRVLNRRSFLTKDECFQIDFSIVKSRRMKTQTLREVIKEDPKYELEIEFIKQDTKVSSVALVAELNRLIKTIVQAYQQSEFILSPAEQEAYLREFNLSKIKFFNPVTFKRKHMRESAHSIWEGYTVTVKADGERSGMYVARDRRVLRITSRPLEVRWTGLKCLDDSYHGTFMDGEYIAERNLYCIFDCYHYKGKNTMSLPLMAEKSRLTHAEQFVQDIKNFVSEPTLNPLKIEKKLFKAGDGPTMEKAIRELLDMKYEYATDGLIFTPKMSPVAPDADTKGATWTRVYKWKPPYQNSIDFLVKFTDRKTFDPVLDTEVQEAHLFVSQNSGELSVYPCETMTGEYVPRELPADFQVSGLRIPAYFQPTNPKKEDAYNILIPIDSYPKDSEGQRVQTNTIIECAYDTNKERWSVMRTRYEKTLQFKQGKNYGQDFATADDIWNSIHVAVSEDMLKNFVSAPLDPSEFEDEYYLNDIKRNTRALSACYDFHNKVKDMLYAELTENQTLLELGAGRGGDMHRWKRSRLSKIVGIEPVESNIKEGCRRYIEDKKMNPRDFRPLVLYVKGDMTLPLYEQESERFRLLEGTEPGKTKYLEQFSGLKMFDASSCQFAIHYACESEEVFRVFVKNVVRHSRKFIGTCLDGKAVYGLLAGKKSHRFTNGREIGGEYQKEYSDEEMWSDRFGLGMNVSMESFPTQKEYLVPFDKVVSIFEEEGWALSESKLFKDLYKDGLNVQQQEFSFLNRTFIFEKKAKPEPEKEPEPEKKEETKEPEPEKKETSETEEPKKKRKLKKVVDEKDIPVLFHGSGEDKGPYKYLDNQAEYPIQVESKQYPTVEHYFQSMKAQEFGDQEILDKIAKTPSGKAVKALGKKVKNFIKEQWDARRIEIMARGVRAKFVQHPELQKQLLETGDKQIGEADARDSFWGIGTSEATELSKDPSKWKGQNQLGKILMNLRSEFKQ
jgi:ribA/ribD-fused uncharacterized protein